MVLFKGRIFFKQYIKSKRARFGLKLFKLVDSNGVTVKTTLHCGNLPFSESMTKTEMLVWSYMQEYKQRGHHLFLDNYYTSNNICKHLKAIQIDVTGTVRANRTGSPTEAKSLKLAKGEFKSWKSEQNMLFVLFSDRNVVRLLSTCHDNSMSNVREKSKEGSIQKKVPTSISEYRQKMGYVDKTDQVLQYYSILRKSCKWYKKIGFY